MRKFATDLLRSRKVLVVTGILVIVAGLVATHLVRRAAVPAEAAVPVSPAIPVSATTVRKATLPIYATGLGTVQAINTVSIHAQIDGKLQEVLFVEGQHVHKDDILAKIDPRLYQAALDQAKAKKGQDEANQIAYEKDLERFKSLAVKSFETQQNVDLQQAKVDQGKAQIAADIASIESAATQLDYTIIRSPIDGRIGVRQIDPGNIVHATDQTALAIVTQTQPTAVMFTLPSQYLDAVRDAMRQGPVEVSAFDRDNRRELAKGTLLLIDNIIDQATATIRLKATFPNKGDALWPGEFINARILIEMRADAIAIPSSAVQRGPDGVFAWVATADNKADVHPLQLGPESGDQVIVKSGIADGDRVITDGYFRLQRDSQVTLKPERSR